jgi:hypothetical protein
MIITFCFSLDHDSEGSEYHIYTGLIDIPSSSGVVAVSVVSKNVPHTLEVCTFFTVFIVVSENFLKLLYEHGNESKEMKSDKNVEVKYSRDVKTMTNTSCSDII